MCGQLSLFQVFPSLIVNSWGALYKNYLAKPSEFPAHTNHERKIKLLFKPIDFVPSRDNQKSSLAGPKSHVLWGCQFSLSAWPTLQMDEINIQNVVCRSGNAIRAADRWCVSSRRVFSISDVTCFPLSSDSPNHLLREVSLSPMSIYKVLMTHHHTQVDYCPCYIHLCGLLLCGLCPCYKSNATKTMPCFFSPLCPIPNAELPVSMQKRFTIS